MDGITDAFKAEVLKIVDNTFNAAVRATLVGVKKAMDEAMMISDTESLTAKEIHNILDAAMPKVE